MSLNFPTEFLPPEMIVAVEQCGSVAEEGIQLAQMRQDMASMGMNVSAEAATRFVDGIEAKIASELPLIELMVEHTFTPGMYGRKIFMPAGVLLTSKIHETRHQYVILSGKVAVWTKETGLRIYRAPYEGITEPGTRRILYTFEDTYWKTFHPNPDNVSDPADFVASITTSHDNPLLNAALGRLQQ